MIKIITLTLTMGLSLGFSNLTYAKELTTLNTTNTINSIILNTITDIEQDNTVSTNDNNYYTSFLSLPSKYHNAQVKILDTIENTVSQLKEEQLQANAEYKEAYLSTGGTIEDFREPSFEIDFEILSLDDNYMSVVVYRYQALASSFTYETYYTFDLKTGELITLDELLWDDYEQFAKDQIIKTAEYRQENGDIVYFDDALENIVIDETTSFYIDDSKNIIVVFPKYELAAGFYGKQEFIINDGFITE